MFRSMPPSSRPPGREVRAMLGRVWAGLFGFIACIVPAQSAADSIPVEVLDPNLQVDVYLNSGMTQPIGIVFLGVNDFLVLEKASGQVKRVIGGVVQPTPVLDLAVNSASERGLLSMALHPNFPATPFVYIRWTESSTGADTTVMANVPVLGNRVDRYHLERIDADVRPEHHRSCGPGRPTTSPCPGIPAPPTTTRTATTTAA